MFSLKIFQEIKITGEFPLSTYRQVVSSPFNVTALSLNLGKAFQH